MARYTIDINNELEYKLKIYMKENNIKFRSVAIKKCIEDVTNKATNKIAIFELDRKLNRLLYRENQNRKLLEQLFVNMGFDSNKNVSQDPLLKNVYEINNKYIWGLD